MSKYQLALHEIERIINKLPAPIHLKESDIKLDFSITSNIWKQELQLFNNLQEIIASHLEDLKMNLLGKLL